MKRILLVCFLASMAIHCGLEPEPEPDDLNLAQRKALLDVLAGPAREFGKATDVTEAPPFRASSSTNCTPQQLMPPRNCPVSGNMYFTLNLGCNGPSLCCGNDPPCQKDEFSISGLGNTHYNNCTTRTEQGDRVVINGTLHLGVEAKSEFTCSGVYSTGATVRIKGMPSVQLNGREVCPGILSLTATVSQASESVVTLTGEVCGKPVNELYADGCMVTCGSGNCCPGGSFCSTCGTGCIPEGYVDCCNGKHCPPGTQCTADGQNCAY